MAEVILQLKGTITQRNKLTTRGTHVEAFQRFPSEFLCSGINS